MSTILLKKKKALERSSIISSFVLYDRLNHRRIIYRGEYSIAINGPSGYGTYFYRNGASYEGHWENGHREGYGIYRNGIQVYDGDWKKGKRHGFGRQEYESSKEENGTFYEGSWFHGRRHGWGRMKFKDGRLYEGNWFHGDFNQEGLLLFPDGKRFVGEWKRGILDGEGRYWIPGTEDVLEGVWENGVFKRGSVLLRSHLETDNTSLIKRV
ncbi:unnamed protein product [Lepeophtheirus salmonis]|uniref:(salmon louse) hypothetical protein n=1 Tax=Lepeophtheirus salmonis TaxID=72036 RepID=A0A7R8HDK3_LEPSM|nr:unnamed protein product [Lepeophtheirus salmonis]CAF3025151.1 unnamed protein product [Lepeophtheirus salmonis]